MPASTSTPDRPKVDVSDRAASLDRVARLGVLREFLRVLHAWDLLDDLPDDFDPEVRHDWIGEMDALHVALFPYDITPDDPSPEWELVLSRERAMLARLLVRLGERPDALREAAEEFLKQADEGMQGAAAIMADTQRMYEQMSAKGDDS